MSEITTYFNDAERTHFIKIWVRGMPASSERVLVTVLCQPGWNKEEMPHEFQAEGKMVGGMAYVLVVRQLRRKGTESPVGNRAAR